MIIKNLENKIKLAGILSIGCFATSIVISGMVLAFCSLFFTLPPDDEFIKYNMEKAMYLIDDSGLKQYNNLKEKGYFNTILASSATVTIMTDSIKVDMNNLSFEYYGIQRIERETSILKRQLVTTGKLRQIPRTENNPHGLIITDWKTILNKDLDYKVKKNF